ncbi:MAG: peptidase dimerization domain-containing protein, partial [Planctomycetes bacterium]|nr:peptidase dimerization domain-containing protein [Planctomycetota bacterium]
AVGGKIYMARDGLMNDLDVCLAWHPADKTQADTNSSQAIIDFIVEWHGRTAHAAGDPWNGRSAVDGLQVCTTAIEFMREHIKPTSRIHYAIVKGGDVPNVVPDYAKLWCWVRDWERSEADALFARVKKAVEGSAIATETKAEVTVQSGDWEMLVNKTGEKLLHANLEWLGPIAYTDEEQAFARSIQKACGIAEKGLDGKAQPLEGQEMEGGSSDVGDVSWIVPTLHVSVTTAPIGVPWHAWPVVACGGMSIGHKGLVHAAKTLAATMVDLFDDPAAVAAVRAEFEKSTKGITYVPYIPAGPPPLPHD